MRQLISLFFLTIIMLFPQASVLADGLVIEKKAVIFLFDVSQSIGKSDRENYFKNFKQVLSGLSEGDEFVVLKIGEGSQLLRPISTGVIPSKEKGVTEGYYENEKKKILHKAIKLSGALLINSNDKKTSIISAFMAANDYFADKPEAKKIVFLFSDMVEESSLLNMKTGREFPVKKYINLTPNNLRGSKFYIVGVNSSEKDFEKIKRFWTAFIEQSEAKVAYYQYSLTNFTFK